MAALEWRAVLATLCAGLALRAAVQAEPAEEEKGDRRDEEMRQEVGGKDAPLVPDQPGLRHPIVGNNPHRADG